MSRTAKDNMGFGLEAWDEGRITGKGSEGLLEYILMNIGNE